MRLGVFGGAFNPVHNGHINLAKSFITSLKLDLLFIVPTADPPHRQSADFAPPQDRFNMLIAAFSNVEKAVVSDMEFRRIGKSYTYDTVQELKAEYPGADIYLLLGEDQLLKFEEWYRYRDILKDVTLCAAARGENSRKLLAEFSAVRFGKEKVIIADFEPIVVSSSEIRDKIKNNFDISGLVPQCVLDYIMEKGLYRDRL